MCLFMPPNPTHASYAWHVGHTEGKIGHWNRMADWQCCFQQLHLSSLGCMSCLTEASSLDLTWLSVLCAMPPLASKETTMGSVQTWA